MNNLTTAQINAQLKIVKLDGQKFKVPGGYKQPKGYAFYHETLGYFGFEGATSPYNPVGGKQVLLEIFNGGGMTDFNTAVWLKEMEE